MKKLIYACCFIAAIYFSCQKELPEEPDKNKLAITGKQWRLSGYKFDTTKYSDWNMINYDPYYSYNDYYCIPTPLDSPFFGRDYFSPYKCTVVMDNWYYVLSEPYCDFNRQPLLSDTLTEQNLTNDITFNTDGNFDLHISSTQSTFIDWRNSTCSDIKYFPAAKSDYGYKGTWQLDSVENIITLNYQHVYGVSADYAGMVSDFVDTDIPKEEKWKIIKFDNSSLSLNNCLQCAEDSGYRKLYKSL